MTEVAPDGREKSDLQVDSSSPFDQLSLVLSQKFRTGR